MLSIQAGAVGWGAAIPARAQAGYHSLGGEQFHLCITCFVHIVIAVITINMIIIIISFFAFLLNCPYLNSWVASPNPDG